MEATNQPPAVQQDALRYQALAAIICGGKGQQFVEEIAVEGVRPSLEQLSAFLDKTIEHAHGRAA